MNTEPQKTVPKIASPEALPGLSRAIRTSGFSLIEMLAVIGVIAVVAGVSASALRSDNPTVVLKGAQSQIASLATQARGIAILKGTNARLIVNNNPDNPQRYLRLVGIVYEDPENSGNWLPATKGFTLPQRTFLVPPNPSTIPNVTTWAETRTSSADEMSDLAFLSNTEEDYLYIQWNSRGAVTGNGRLALAMAVRGGGNETDVLFINPEHVRGLIVRRYGNFVLLNDATAFNR